MRKFVETAAAVVGLGVFVFLGASFVHSHGSAAETAGSVATPTPATSPTPYPASMRIPADMYSQAGTGIAFTPVDPSTQPQGSIVSQATAETAAKTYGGPGTTVYGTGLANVAGLGASNPTGLYWIVSIDPGYGALRPNTVGHPVNFFNVFVDATTGKVAAGNGSYDPAYQPFANSAGQPTPAPGSSEGLNTGTSSATP
jgi:hypothetical protein